MAKVHQELQSIAETYDLQFYLYKEGLAVKFQRHLRGALSNNTFVPLKVVKFVGCLFTAQIGVFIDRKIPECQQISLQEFCTLINRQDLFDQVQGEYIPAELENTLVEFHKSAIEKCNKALREMQARSYESVAIKARGSREVDTKWDHGILCDDDSELSPAVY